MPKYVTASELAAGHGWTVHKARSLFDRGKIPWIRSRIDGKRRTREDIVELLDDKDFVAALKLWLEHHAEPRSQPPRAGAAVASAATPTALARGK